MEIMAWVDGSAGEDSPYRRRFLSTGERVGQQRLSGSLCIGHCDCANDPRKLDGISTSVLHTGNGLTSEKFYQVVSLVMSSLLEVFSRMGVYLESVWRV